MFVSCLFFLEIRKCHGPLMIYFNRCVLHFFNQLDSERFPFLVVDRFIIVFDVEIKFDMSKYVLIDGIMKMRNGDAKFGKSRCHKILKMLN